MHTDRRLIYLGLFLLVFGGRDLLRPPDQGRIWPDVVASIWQLWPVAPDRDRPVDHPRGRTGSWLGGAVAAVLLGAMAASAIQTGIVPFVGCGGDDDGRDAVRILRLGQLACERRGRLSLPSAPRRARRGDGSGASWTLEGLSG